MFSVYDGGANRRTFEVFVAAALGGDSAEFGSFAGAAGYAYKMLCAHGIECSVFTVEGQFLCRFYRFYRKAA